MGILVYNIVTPIRSPCNVENPSHLRTAMLENALAGGTSAVAPGSIGTMPGPTQVKQGIDLGE